MGEPIWSRPAFWQAWAAVAGLCVVVSGSRSVQRKIPAAVRPAPVQQAPRSAAPSVAENPEQPEAPAQLLQRLADAETGPEKCDLLGQLDAGEDPQTAEAIAAVLNNTLLVSVRLCATQALGAQRAPVARSWLLDLSNDPEPTVHSAALDILAASEDAQEQAAVVEATHDDDPDVRVSAAAALLKAGRGSAFAALAAVLPSVEDRATLESLITALGDSHDARAIPVLDSLIASADRDSHLEAISALSQLGLPGVTERLWALLDSGSEQEFGVATERLNALAPAPLTLKLRVLLNTGSPERRRWALHHLLNQDVPDRQSLLAGVLRSGDTESKIQVMRELTMKPDPAFESQLVAFAQSNERPLASQAYYALSRLETASAQAAVASISEMPNRHLKHHLSKELSGTEEEIRAQRIAQLESAEANENHDTLPSLAADHDPSAQAAALHYVEAHQNATTLMRFVALATPESVQKLLAQAGRFNVDEQRSVISALSQRGDPQFSSELRAALRDQDPQTRADALRGLQNLGDDAARSELARWGRATEHSDRAVAAELLATSSAPDASAQLEALAQDSDAEVVSTALHSLQQHAPEQVGRLAERAFRAASPEDRGTLLSSLSDLRSSVTRPLAELALTDADDSTVSQGIQALTSLAGPDSASRLLAIVTDANRADNVRQEAAIGLRQLGGPLARANRALLDALSPADDSGAQSCNLDY